jgi:hypothetical protein
MASPGLSCARAWRERPDSLPRSPCRPTPRAEPATPPAGPPPAPATPPAARLASAPSISSNVLVAVGFHRTAWTFHHEGVPRGDLLQGSLPGPLPEDIVDGEGEMAHGRHPLGKGIAPVRLQRLRSAAAAISTRLLHRGAVLACAVRRSRVPWDGLPDWKFANPGLPVLQQRQA